jgi:hypothetical protein
MTILPCHKILCSLNMLHTLQVSYACCHLPYTTSTWAFIWLVVLTIFKNISQWEWLSHILWKNKSHVPNHQPVYVYLCDNRNHNPPNMGRRTNPAKLNKKRCWNQPAFYVEQIIPKLSSTHRLMLNRLVALSHLSESSQVCVKHNKYVNTLKKNRNLNGLIRNKRIQY